MTKTDMATTEEMEAYALRPATLVDLPFVLGLVMDGVREGHYAASLLSFPQQKAFGGALRMIVEHGGLGRMTGRGFEVVESKLFIYESDSDKHVGFLLVSEMSPGSAHETLELYKAGIRLDRRRLGHGSRLVSSFMRNYPVPMNFYARCYPESKEMIVLLKRIGFLETGRTPSGTHKLMYIKAEI